MVFEGTLFDSHDAPLMPRVFDESLFLPASIFPLGARPFSGGILSRGQGVAEGTRTNHTLSLHTLQIDCLPPSSSLDAGPLRAVTVRWFSYMHLPRGKQTHNSESSPTP